MKVGDKLYTRDGAGFFYARNIIEIIEINGDNVVYHYLTTMSSFTRNIQDFKAVKLEKLSPVTELFYEEKDRKFSLKNKR